MTVLAGTLAQASEAEAMGAICLLLLILWVAAAIAAVVSLFIKPLVSPVAAGAVALIVFFIWLVVC